MTTTVDRFDLLELDLPSHPMVPPPVQAAPQRAMAPIAAAAAVVTDRDFSPVVRSLAQQEAEIAAEAGFAVKGVDDGLLFEAGTKFWDIGEDQLRIYAAEFGTGQSDACSSGGRLGTSFPAGGSPDAFRIA